MIHICWLDIEHMHWLISLVTTKLEFKYHFGQQGRKTPASGKEWSIPDPEGNFKGVCPPPHSRNTPWVEEEEEGCPSQVHTIGLKEGYIVVESVKTVQDTNG